MSVASPQDKECPVLRSPDRKTAIDSVSKSSSMMSARRAATPLFLLLLTCAIASPVLRAQTATARPAKAGAPADTSPLARFVPKENLAVYFEFSGLDSHDAAWKNTASYKMLTETPLGEMLSMVSEQLLDKVLSFVPSRRLSGGEIVTLVKHSARLGWVVALNTDPKAPLGYRGTFVLRGGADKETRQLSSRLMGWFMGSVKPRVEPKSGRSLVLVTATAAQGAGPNAADWVWWAENSDLIVGLLSPASADSIIAAIDGKTPSAREHDLVKELSKSDGKFEPVCIGFVDPSGATGSPSQISTALQSLKSDWGVDRLELRWGFEAAALVSDLRLVAAKPRKGALSIFDGATFDKTALLPMPDQIDSFFETSISTLRLVEVLKEMAPSGAVADYIDEIAESIKKAGSIDLEKDLLAHLGPRIVAYLGPGRSAATNDDSLESALSKGWSPTAAIAALQSAFPKLTVVAEVSNPAAFSKALDAIVVALNKELKGQAIEKALEDRKEAESKDGGNRGAGGRMGGGDRNKSRRPIQQTPSPRFEMTPATGKAKVYTLTTPSGSPLHLGPTSFRPTIELEGNHVVFAVSPESAHAALAAVKRKDWKPSDNLAKVCENVPGKLVLLGVTAVSETLPPLLASLPGTLQTMINTSVALAKSRGDASQAEDKTAPPGPGPAGARGGRSRPGGAVPGVSASMPQNSGRPGAIPGGGMGNATLNASSTGSTPESAIVFNIDAEKLPKSGDLKAYLFPSTLAISVSDQDVRIVSRGAFPDFSSLVNLAPIAGMMPAARSLLDLSKLAGESQGPNAPGAPAGAAAQPASGAAGASRPGGGPPAATSKPGLPGGRRGGNGPAPR